MRSTDRRCDRSASCGRPGTKPIAICISRWNSGIPIADPSGGFFFVFMAGEPAFRKYDDKGTLIYERVVQGREIDPLVAAIPDRWPRRSSGELPLVAPMVRTAAVDRSGRLWISFVLPFSYVYDSGGEKIRTVQFRGAGVVSPSSLWFNEKGRVLVTPGCYEFDPGVSCRIKDGDKAVR